MKNIQAIWPKLKHSNKFLQIFEKTKYESHQFTTIKNVPELLIKL